MNFSFTTQDIIALSTLLLALIGALLTTYKSLYKKVESTATSFDIKLGTVVDKINDEFKYSNEDRQKQFNKLDATIEKNRVEAYEGRSAIHSRIDEVKIMYARREDITALTTAITTLNGRIDLIITSLAGKHG